MPLNKPDILQHNNPLNPIVDSNFTRGGIRSPVNTLTELYQIGSGVNDKVNQLKQYSTRVYVSGEGEFYILKDLSNRINISGWQSESNILGKNIVYTSGNQTISGVKNFATGIFAPNLVYNTGDQLITGNKIFIGSVGLGHITAPNNNKLYLYDASGQAYNTIKSYSIGDFRDNVIFELSDQGLSTFSIDVMTKTISGDDNSPINFSNRPTVNGTRVLLSGEAAGLPDTLVYTTGNQTISGIKTFDQTGSFNTLQITNKKISSYSLNSTNFIFADNYLNFANSLSNLTGTLPSGIVSGINYYAKNLNSGIFFISGSGSRTIDGFSTLNLYRNESVQLVGVNSIGYTGWVTISADGGIS